MCEININFWIIVSVSLNKKEAADIKEVLNKKRAYLSERVG